jgi:hypothetical protein
LFGAGGAEGADVMSAGKLFDVVLPAAVSSLNGKMMESEGHIGDWTKTMTFAGLRGYSAGLDINKGMAVAREGAKAFGLSATDTQKYFSSLERAAGRSNLRLEDFIANMGDVKQMGIEFGAAGAVIAAQSGLIAGAGGPDGARNMSETRRGAFQQLGVGLANMDVAHQIGWAMAAQPGLSTEMATKQYAEEALGTKKNGIGAVAYSFNNLTKMADRYSGAGFKEGASATDQLKSALFLSGTTGQKWIEKAFLGDENVRKVFQGKISGTAAADVMKNAEKNYDDVQKGLTSLASMDTGITALTNAIGSMAKNVGRIATSHWFTDDKATSLLKLASVTLRR